MEIFSGRVSCWLYMFDVRLALNKRIFKFQGYNHSVLWVRFKFLNCPSESKTITSYYESNANLTETLNRFIWILQTKKEKVKTFIYSHRLGLNIPDAATNWNYIWLNSMSGKLYLQNSPQLANWVARVFS